MSSSPIRREVLTTYEGLHISAICSTVRFTDDAQNHCAHFVNHVLGFAGPLTCGQLLGRAGPAANIRVHETFARCPLVGLFEQRPRETPCLAFVTQASAVDLAGHAMLNIPKKHVGIFCDGDVWHYSNSARRVVRQSPEAFAEHFAGEGFALFFGTFPEGSFALLAPPSSSSDGALPATLERGQRDNVDVATWQQFLIIRKLLSAPRVQTMLDGNFGPLTEEATEAFQISCGLAAHGRVDAFTNVAAIEHGFIPRVRATARAAIEHVTPAMTEAAIEALHRLGPSSVFYTEEVLSVDAGGVVARLEPHKHTTGTQLRFWHRGITLYQL